MKTRPPLIILSIALASILTGLFACGPSGQGRDSEKSLHVVTTLFPLYDFARNVGGEKARGDTSASARRGAP